MNLPKLSKDQTQKIILSLMMFAILIYGYFQFLLGPLAKKDAANIKAVAELEKNISEASRSVRLGSNAVESSLAATATMRQIDGMIPKEAAIAWFPPKVSNFFDKRGVPKVTVKLRGTEKVSAPGLQEFKNFTWDVAFPPANFINVITALHQLENEDPLLAINTISVQSSPDNPDNQTISAAFTILLK